MSTASPTERARLILALAGARGWKLSGVYSGEGSTPAEVLGTRWEKATEWERDAFEVELARVEAEPSLRAMLLAGPDEPGSVRMAPAVALSETRGPQEFPGGGEETLPAGRDRYEVRTEHARGGMGRVLVVIDRQVGREVAMKELLPKFAQGMAWDRERFLREARITGQLEHPNIVPVYEIGAAAGEAAYYTMKLVRGETIEARLERIRKSVGVTDRWRVQERLKLLDAFIDACNAVAFAHSRGVVNRDLKPANIMLGDFGETVVLDWGLARILGQAEPEAPAKTTPAPGEGTRSGDTTRLTMDGDILGTPEYMAPEQARGDVENIDERSDIYALGVMLYEIIAGRPPFEGQTAFDILRAVIEQDAKPADEADPLAPRELAAVAAAAMEKDRSRRLASARTLAEDVKAWRDGRAMSLYRHTPLEQLRRFARHNRALALALGGVVLALVAGVAVSLGYARLASNRAAAEEIAHREADMRTDEARRARQESQASLRLAQGQRMAAYSINLLSENPTAALLIATEAARRAPGTASTNALWTALCELLERSRFLGHEHNVTDGEFSPDGLRVATSGADFTARIWDPATGVELQRLEGHRSSVDRVAWSPDGTRLLTVPGDPALERHAAFQPKGSIDVAPRIWDTATGQCLRVLNGHTGVLHGASWAPGGRVLSWSADATVRLWGADGDATVFRTPWPVYEAAISADGRWVAAVPMFETAGLLWRVESPSEPRPLEGHTREGVRFDFAADSRSILTLCRAGRVLRRDLETLAILQDFRILRPAVDNPGGPPDRQILVYKAIHHPDGKRVALQSDLGIHVLTSDFSKELSFCEFPEGRLTHRNLDRDWTRGLIWIGPGAVARDLATGKDLVRFRGHEYNLEFACFSPDGRRMISGGRDRAAIVWDTAPGACLPTFGWGATQKQVFTNLDGTIALVRGPDGGLEKRDNATGKLLASWPFEGPISSIRVSGNDRHFILNSPGAQELLVGDMDKGPIGNISLNGLLPWTQFSRNGEWLLAAIGGGEARIVEMATLKPGPIFKTPPVTYDFAAISDDGSVFAMIDAATATVAVYDSADQHLVCRATGHTGWTISTAFGADGTLYSTAMDASVRAWNPRTGEFLRTGRWPLIQETFIVMGRRGDVLALDTGYTARFYDAHTLDDIGALPKSCSSPVSFTPDERFAVVRRAGVILHLPMDALRFAESVAPREMTPLEQRGLADSRAEADEYAAAYAKRHPRASTSLQRGNRALQAGNWALALEHAAEARRLRSPGPELPVLSARALGLQAAGLKEDEQARVAALDAAFEALSEAIDRGYRDVETLESDSALAPLRQDSRWAALLSRAKRLPWE